MKVVQDDLWLCTDCTIYAVNGDTSGIESEKRERKVVEGVDELGPHLMADFDSETGDGIYEFSSLPCDACGTYLAGERHRFVVFGENPIALSPVETGLLIAGGVGLLAGIVYLITRSPPAQAPAPVGQQLPMAGPVTMPGTYEPGSPGSWTT